MWLQLFFYFTFINATCLQCFNCFASNVDVGFFSSLFSIVLFTLHISVVGDCNAFTASPFRWFYFLFTILNYFNLLLYICQNVLTMHVHLELKQTSYYINKIKHHITWTFGFFYNQKFLFSLFLTVLCLTKNKGFLSERNGY